MRNLLEQVAGQFIERFRRGELSVVSDAVEEYAAEHPQLASEIRDVFPTMLLMEQLAPEEAKTEGATFGTPSSTPSLVGDYQILREIGRGGMGIVYEAEQLALGRRVALKVLPKQSALRGHGHARFQLEARAVAKLQHPHIVPIYDVGQDGDCSYYAMQYIHGQSLDNIVDELRVGGTTASVADKSIAADGSTERPVGDTRPMNSSLSGDDSSGQHYYRSVARIGIGVADALQHAHDRGIIHRDIKPSNLILDTDGTVWVADFGLAKMDQSDLTDSGDFVGTLRYMSPERFRGWSDPRSDVYSLGITLYELLALQPAFDSPDRIELVRLIGDETPRRLRAMNRRIPRDLETIVHKCIEKEPEHRYHTAEQLKDELNRFLDFKPLLASRQSLLERALKWSHRHQRLLLATSALLLLCVVVLGTGLVLLWQERQRTETQRRVAVQLAEEKTQLAGAEIAARQNMEDMFEYMVTALSSPDPKRDGRSVTVVEVLDQAIEEIETSFDDPLIQARLLREMCRTYQGLGLFSEAITLAERSRDLFAAHAGDNDGATLVTISELGHLFWKMGRYEDARDAHLVAVDGLARAVADDDERLMVARHRYAVLLSTLREFDSAIPVFQETVQWRRDHFGDHDATTLGAMNDLAVTYRKAGFADQAMELQAAIVENAEQHLGPSHPYTLTALNNMAVSHFKAGQVAEAVELWERRYQTSREHLGAQHPDTLLAMVNLATGFHRLGEPETALALLQEMVATARTQLGMDHQYTRRATSDLSQVYLELDRPDDALSLWQEVVQSHRENTTRDDRQFVVDLIHAARAMLSANAADSATDLLTEAMAVIDSGVNEPGLRAAVERLLVEASSR